MHGVITVKNLTKVFMTRETFPGISGAIKGLFCGKKIRTAAIEGLSFSVQKGERIAFIGPNGAGKSTTIKMLTNIYSGFIQFVMFTFIPAGVIGYIPVELLRFFSIGKLIILLMSSIGFSALAFFVFYAGIKRYESGNRFGMRL